MNQAKTVSVRIKAEQMKKLREIADKFPVISINAVVQRAVDQWLEIEGPVYLEHARKIKENLKRQPVSLDGKQSQTSQVSR